MSKRGITYIKQEEPNFLKKFKEQIGYKEDAKVEDKFQKSEKLAQGPDPDEEEKDDEKPTVVQLRATDLSSEEAGVEWRRCETESGVRTKDEEGVMRGPPTDDQGKIRFRRPKKKEENVGEESQKDSEKSANQSKDTDKKDRKDKSEKKDKKRDVKAVKKSNLLSFGEDEEED